MAHHRAQRSESSSLFCGCDEGSGGRIRHHLKQVLLTCSCKKDEEEDLYLRTQCGNLLITCLEPEKEGRSSTILESVTEYFLQSSHHLLPCSFFTLSLSLSLCPSQQWKSLFDKVRTHTASHCHSLSICMFPRPSEALLTPSLNCGRPADVLRG